MDSNIILRNLYKKSIEFGKVEGLIDNRPSTFLIRDCNDNDTNMIDYKTIISSDWFKQGDVLSINDNKYLIIDKDEQFTQATYNKGTFRKAQDLIIGDIVNISLKNTLNTVGIVDVNKDLIISTDVISVISDEMKFIIPYSQLISINKGVLYKNNIFKITHIDNSKDGVLTLIAKFNTKGINYEISLKEDNIIKDVGNRYQINPICKADGVIVDNPTVEYQSNNETVATVDNTGLVNCIGEGSTIITCTYMGVTCSLNITVNAVGEVSYTISGVDTLKINTTSTYTVTPEVGNIEIILDSYTQEGGIAEIVESTPYSVTIKALVSDDVATIQVLQNRQVKAEMFIMTTKR